MAQQDFDLSKDSQEIEQELEAEAEHDKKRRRGPQRFSLTTKKRIDKDMEVIKQDFFKRLSKIKCAESSAIRRIVFKDPKKKKPDRIVRENIKKAIVMEEKEFKDPNIEVKQKYLDQLQDLSNQYVKAIKDLKEGEIQRLFKLYINETLDKPKINKIKQIFVSLFGEVQQKLLMLRFIQAKRFHSQKIQQNQVYTFSQKSKSDSTTDLSQVIRSIYGGQTRNISQRKHSLGALKRRYPERVIKTSQSRSRRSSMASRQSRQSESNMGKRLNQLQEEQNNQVRMYKGSKKRRQNLKTSGYGFPQIDEELNRSKELKTAKPKYRESQDHFLPSRIGERQKYASHTSNNFFTKKQKSKYTSHGDRQRYIGSDRTKFMGSSFYSNPLQSRIGARNFNKEYNHQFTSVTGQNWRKKGQKGKPLTRGTMRSTRLQSTAQDFFNKDLDVNITEKQPYQVTVERAQTTAFQKRKFDRFFRTFQ